MMYPVFSIYTTAGAKYIGQLKIGVVVLIRYNNHPRPKCGTAADCTARHPLARGRLCVFRPTDSLWVVGIVLLLLLLQLSAPKSIVNNSHRGEGAAAMEDSVSATDAPALVEESAPADDLSRFSASTGKHRWVCFVFQQLAGACLCLPSAVGLVERSLASISMHAESWCGPSRPWTGWLKDLRV